MDLGVLLLQLLKMMIWTSVMVAALILVSKIFLFYFIFSKLMADNADPTQFDSGYRPWKKFTLIGDALYGGPVPPSPGTTASTWD